MSTIKSSDVLDWAKSFQAKANAELTDKEVKEQKMFASLTKTPTNKKLLCKMLDESSQIRDDGKLSRRMKKLIDQYGIPTMFGTFDQFQLWLFKEIGYVFTPIAIPLFKKKLREETKNIIIAEERPQLTNHLKKRWQDQIGQNVNLLGEVVLGDEEAHNRYEHYMDALKEPDINYISVKLSGIYAQIRSLAYDQNKKELCEMIANIFQQAIDNPYEDYHGISKPKFVNLDMEEYKDAELTMDVFMTVLSMPQFKHYTAGIVIQAYLADAPLFYNKLLAFAKKRFAAGGAPLKFRLVKGANLEMEKVQSSLKGWNLPILPTKIDVDANYLSILDMALKPENAQALHVGVASHNFFTIGYAYLLSQQNKVNECVTFEMLEGMANNLPRVMKSLGKHTILYTPVVKAENFLNAVSYLVRRLDENTGKDNFLRYTFDLVVDSTQWQFLANQFLEAYKKKDNMTPAPLRVQDRNKHTNIGVKDQFVNESDTDFDLPQNRTWALDILKKWEGIRADNFKIPVQIGDKEITTDKKRTYLDRSRNDEINFCEASMSSLEHIKEIVDIADADKSNWRKSSVSQRRQILHKVADKLGKNRGELLGCMAAITSKSVTEGDVEVSEAIDFCRFYPLSMEAFDKLENIEHKPKGTILVISPWNFPLAIPVGGVAAALSAGNTVILKPASVALPIAWKFAECFWDAGVPKDTLQVVCCADSESLNYLTSHKSIQHVILTGSTETAFNLLKKNPKTALSAETGGKNAIILTDSGDADHTILNVVQSAFGNAGQKCSACSLLLVEKNTYNSDDFRRKLKDATLSMRTGSAWDTINLVGPMITNKNDKLTHAIENLEPGESWLVEPEYLDEKKYILKPSVKWGVRPNSFTFKNELFAPLLSVVCVDNLKQAIKYVNSSDYGLTSGLQSLDPEEQEIWKNSIEAGNLYINRGITGAIVHRQPFGGMKLSAFGGGIKAGGPNYVSCFVNFEEKTILANGKSTSPLSKYLKHNDDINRLNYATTSYEAAYKNEFSLERDVYQLYGEENIFRYLPLKNMVFRIDQEDKFIDILLVILASHIAQTPLTISINEGNSNSKFLNEVANDYPHLSIKIEPENDFMSNMHFYDRIRTCTKSLSNEAYAQAADLPIHIVSEKPLVEGRIELLHYLKEQSITNEYHRYGSMFDKDEE